MLKHRLFNLLIAIVLVIVTGLTVREAVATTIVRSQGNSIIRCANLPSRHSIRTEYVKEAHIWVVGTENGPTGTDGGLLDLLANYRTCTK